jgi:two-component sensor histidine kinase
LLVTPLRAAPEPKPELVVPLIRRGTLLFLLLMWALALVTAAVAVWLLLARAAYEVHGTAQGLEQYARRTMEIGDFVADEFARYLRARGSTEVLQGDPEADAELARLNRRLPLGSGGIFVLPDGRVTISNNPLPEEPIDLSDRRWFQAHVKEGYTSYVGPAIHSRVVDRVVFTYTKSHFGTDGRLLGIIDLGIPSDSILNVSPNGMRMNVALVQHEGPIVAGQPLDRALLGKPFELPSKPGSQDGTVIGTAFGTLSLAGVTNLPDYGLYAVAAVPLFTVLQPAIWGVAIGLAALGLLSFVILKLSHIAQQKSHQVEQALADNRVLFQEVHHRVKNNLQVISSLIRLQTDRLPEELRPLMEQTAARVRAIAMVHEQIYTTAQSPSVVQLDKFLAQLLEQVDASLMAGSRAKLSADMEPVTVSLDRAVPVALLATEAITNAIKHGVPEEGGSIAVALRREAGSNVLRVTNSGRPPEADGKGGLGSRIMTVLARQIDGSWKLEPLPAGGTCFTLVWPAAEHG